ncbi:hypothetical protein D3C87_323360 [compost metagenome]
MGYTTQFKGELKFTNPITHEEFSKLQTILGEDVRDHPEWEIGVTSQWITYIDLEINPSSSGLRWTGDEKTYGMEHAIPLIVRLMREDFPEFGLEGRLFAQGEEVGDVYYINVDSDVVTITSPLNDA